MHFKSCYGRLNNSIDCCECTICSFSQASILCPLYNIEKVTESNRECIYLVEKMERCLKEEVKTCLQEKLQHCILEEMKNHFKLMEDSVVKRMEQMMKMSRDDKLGISDSASPIDGGKEE